MRVPRKCNERCYINRVLPVLLKRHVSFLLSLKLLLLVFKICLSKLSVVLLLYRLFALGVPSNCLHKSYHLIVFTVFGTILLFGIPISLIASILMFVSKHRT